MHKQLSKLWHHSIVSLLQAIKLVDAGYRLPPPPGCPRAIYEFMIECWWVTTRTHARRHTHARTHARTHAHTHARMHTRTCGCAHTHTHTQLGHMITLMSSFRNPEPSYRPTFTKVVQTLSQSDDTLLKWEAEDIRSHPQVWGVRGSTS